MNKNTLDQLKRKDSMVKKHISQQDSDISKLKGRIVDMEKQIKALKEEIQVRTYWRTRGFFTRNAAKDAGHNCLEQRQGGFD